MDETLLLLGRCDEYVLMTSVSIVSRSLRAASFEQGRRVSFLSHKRMTLY